MESAIISVEIMWRKLHFYLSTKEHKFHEIFVILITNEKFVWFFNKICTNLTNDFNKMEYLTIENTRNLSNLLYFLNEKY